MTTMSWLNFGLSGFLLCLVQLIAALPWLILVGTELFRSWRGLIQLFVGLVAAGALAGAGLWSEQDPEVLATVGRWYGVVLYAQLLIDVIVLAFGALRLCWARGGAIAVAAFRESVRQPMFWFLTVFASLAILVMPFIPYFTFGEDLKMIKELGYDIIMLFAAAFGVIAASISISEEIEGRTAVTVMSKPVSRRQFLLGKFAGILMASFLMTAILSVVYLLVLWFKPLYDRDTIVPPLALLYRIPDWLPAMLDPALGIVGGAAWWLHDVVAASPGLVLGFCQVMVLISVSVALATRLPMVLNLVLCLLVFFLGHLTPVLEQVSRTRLALIHFMAQLFDILLPGLDLFNIGPALTRDALPPAHDFAIYVGCATAYAAVYTSIALLLGLILFEDRDLA